MRNDSVLNRLISNIKEVIVSIRKKGDPKSLSMKFVPEGTPVRNPPKSKPFPSGLLHFAKDWKNLCVSFISLKYTGRYKHVFYPVSSFDSHRANLS